MFIIDNLHLKSNKFSYSLTGNNTIYSIWVPLYTEFSWEDEKVTVIRAFIHRSQVFLLSTRNQSGLLDFPYIPQFNSCDHRHHRSKTIHIVGKLNPLLFFSIIFWKLYCMYIIACRVNFRGFLHETLGKVVIKAIFNKVNWELHHAQWAKIWKNVQFREVPLCTLFSTNAKIKILWIFFWTKLLRMKTGLPSEEKKFKKALVLAIWGR